MEFFYFKRFRTRYGQRHKGLIFGLSYGFFMKFIKISYGVGKLMSTHQKK